VDASTVSRRLAALEEALALTLFDRGPGGVSPTEAAEDLLPVAEEMEATMLRFAAAAEGFEREVAGSVRVACPPDLAEVILVPLVGDLLTRHPRLQITIEPGEAVLDLSRREADLAIRTVRPTRGDLVVTSLGSVRWVVAGTATTVRALGMLKRWSDAPWVAWGERLSSSAPAHWLAEHARVEPRVRSDSLMFQIALLKAGAGIALVPEPSLEHYGLVPVRLASALQQSAATWPEDELFLLTHRALRSVPRVRAVWDAVLARCGARRSASGS
jgi:DNA-binding transcriptional LysR family regulator